MKSFIWSPRSARSAFWASDAFSYAVASIGRAARSCSASMPAAVSTTPSASSASPISCACIPTSDSPFVTWVFSLGSIVHTNAPGR